MGRNIITLTIGHVRCRLFFNAEKIFVFERAIGTGIGTVASSGINVLKAIGRIKTSK